MRRRRAILGEPARELEREDRGRIVEHAEALDGETSRAAHVDPSNRAHRGVVAGGLGEFFGRVVEMLRSAERISQKSDSPVQYRFERLFGGGQLFGGIRGAYRRKGGVRHGVAADLYAGVGHFFKLLRRY